jgi:hypothetical protein
MRVFILYASFFRGHYVNQIERVPPNPEWVEIEGYGRITRAQALGAKYHERLDVIQLPDSVVVALRWLPAGWNYMIQ